MTRQTGFTLFELMISISIIAILSAIGIPAYQSYMQKAAMTDALQAVVPYRTAVELCVLEQGNMTSCQQGSHSIPVSRSTRYISSIEVHQGNIKLSGQQTLQGLNIVLKPELDITTGNIRWSRRCSHSANSASQIEACEAVFRFDAPENIQ